MIFSWKTTFFPKTKKELNEKRWHCFTFFESFYCSAPEKTWLSCLLSLSCCGLLSDTSNVKKTYLHRDVLLERYIVTPFQITVTFPVLFHSSMGRILTSWLWWALPHPHTFHTLMATSTATVGWIFHPRMTLCHPWKISVIEYEQLLKMFTHFIMKNPHL